MPEIIESASPCFNSSAAWSRDSAGRKSTSGNCLIASFTMGLVLSSGKIIFIGIFYHKSEVWHCIIYIINRRRNDGKEEKQ